MRYIDNGCFFSVSVSRVEVEEFKDNWPCSTLPERALWFQFDKRNGDLVDMKPDTMEGEDVAALADDCKAWGMKRLAAVEVAS